MPACDRRWTILYDRSQTIRDSVDDVQITLLIAAVLVVAVIFLFLRTLSATIIPSLALPIAVIGTFAGMALLGYSLDNLSLMALTLSVGFVVDDAIVMLENIVRHIEMGEKPFEAALQGRQRNRLHHPVHDPVAGGGVHSRRLHGRHRRPAAARIRRHHRARDPVLGHRLGDADAHAVQPLPQDDGKASSHGRSIDWSENTFNRMQACYERSLQMEHAAPAAIIFACSSPAWWPRSFCS